MFPTEFTPLRAAATAPDADPTLATLIVPPRVWFPGTRLTPPDPYTGVVIDPTTKGLVVAPAASRPVAVRPSDLPAFVLAHPHLRWVAFDAAATFWHVHAAVSHHPLAADAWWRVVVQNRLHDPVLLDALVRLSAGRFPFVRAPDAVAAVVGITAGPAELPADPARATAAYRVLRRSAVAVPVPSDVLADARARFGLLTEAVQVKKAIALAALTRAGVRLDRAALAAAGPPGLPVLRCLDGAGGPVVFPAYQVLTATGRTSCSGPNVQGVPRLGGVREAFIPTPGHLLLTIDYETAELRALAAVCRRRYGQSALADVLAAGGDPHAHTAAALLGVSPAEARARADYRECRQAAKAVNFGVPGGLGVAALADLARTRFGAALTAEAAAAFRERLVGEIYPELGRYLADARDGRVATLTGRVRGGVRYTQALNTPFQGLAADGAGLGLFHLVRAGYRVVDFVHDEFLIEVPDRGGYADRADVERAVSIARAGMEVVLGSVPAACTWTVGRRWGAVGTHVVVGDRVYPPP